MNVRFRDEGRAPTAGLLDHESEYDGTRLMRGFRNALLIAGLFWIVLCVGVFVAVARAH